MYFELSLCETEGFEGDFCVNLSNVVDLSGGDFVDDDFCRGEEVLVDLVEVVNLLSTGHVSKISKNANGITSIEAIPLKKFKVKVVLNNQFEYDKIVPEISKLKFKVTDKEMRESGFGICIAIFDVTVKKASASDIKAGVWRAVRSVCPNVKHHSISVEPVAN